MRNPRGSGSAVTGAGGIQWYADWQNPEHATQFDFRSSLRIKDLQRSYESLNDVCLLNERVEENRPVSLLEMGCATGEFYRYLKFKHPNISYYGVDVSKPVIARAKEKYPETPFFVVDPSNRVSSQIERLPIPPHPEIVYAKDVLHHQIDPFGFLSELLDIASEAVILRCRTRDIGETVLDPALSCQYHYDGWMPYIVINLQELVDHVRRQAASCEVVVYRSHMVLGGQHNRYLPKDCYLPETGTAETAVGVFKKTGQPRKVTVGDRKDPAFRFTLSYRLRRRAGAVLRRFLSQNHS